MSTLGPDSQAPYRYEPTYECQHLDPTRRFLHRSWVLHQDPAQTMYPKSKLAYQARQVEVEQAVPSQLQQAGGQEEEELLCQEEGLGGRG